MWFCAEVDRDHMRELIHYPLYRMQVNHTIVSLVIEKIEVLKLLLFENLYEIKHYKNKMLTWYMLCLPQLPYFF